MKKVLIVGSGIGGLATALRLVKRGYQVEIVEKYSKPGGRLNQIKKDGFTFDTGPSFFSMSYEFEELAKDCGITLPFKYTELEPLYAVNFGDKSKTFLVYKDIKKFAEQFKDIEPDIERKMKTYLKKCQKRYNDTVDIVIKKNFDSLLSYILTLARVNPIHLPLLFLTFWDEVSRNFDSKEVREIISLIAFFLGRTPFDTMGIYTLLSYVEFEYDGYYNVEGGMYKIVEGFVKLLERENVKFTFNTEIVDFQANDNKLEFLIDKNGNKWSADIFVINADAASFRGSVFRRRKYSPEILDKKKWTAGYLTFYLGVKTKLSQLHQHNYFIGKNYEKYANEILINPNVLERPYYYVNVLSRNNPECAPEGCESLFFVCPVPNLLIKKDWSDKELIVNNIIDDFSKRIGKDIKSEIISKTIFTPIDWQNTFNLYRGSGLGLAHSFWQIGAFRPPNFDEEFKNVFYVGASTVPGAGIPMSIIGSKLVLQRILKYDS